MGNKDLIPEWLETFRRQQAEGFERIESLVKANHAELLNKIDEKAEQDIRDHLTTLATMGLNAIMTEEDLPPSDEPSGRLKSGAIASPQRRSRRGR